MSCAQLSKSLVIAVLLSVSGASMFFSSVRLSRFTIQPEGRDFVVTWEVDVEDGVREYELMRRTPLSNDQFVRVFAANAHGIRKPYTFRDTQVYKAGSDQLEYRLEVVYQNGVREAIKVQAINYTSTAVRRTWGGLKAMFQ
jgi:hypothetical protein